MKRVVKTADLIFARDRVSYDHLVDLAGPRENLRIAPDFTNLLEGLAPAGFNQNINRFCLIPNYRMIDKTPEEQSTAYLPFMIQCARYLAERKSGPFILIHEGDDDLRLAKEINVEAGGQIPIIIESDPIKIKGILGSCDAVLGSRFHGLVSALSQGVPALATSWSHKYRMLLDDYGFPEGLIDITCSEAELRGKIDMLIDHRSRYRIHETIAGRSTSLKQQSLAMWSEVFELINT
jgi:colanic acid/amylovoran biosynthesis protein